MRKKAPVLDGKLPDNEFILDDEAHMKSLGLDLNTTLKIADEYDHYPNCKHVVMEHKSKSLKDSVTQLESTTKQLEAVGRHVDLAVVVADRINRTESMIYKQDKSSHRLISKISKSPLQIRSGSKLVDILIFYTHQVSKMHREYGGKMDRWVST